MRIPKTSVRTGWRADWLVEFSMALVALALLMREIIFAAVGAGILLSLASLGLIFHQRLGILRRELHVAQRLSKTGVFLGDSVEGELTIRNGSRFAAQILTVQPVLEKALSFRPSSSMNQLLWPGITSSSKFAIMPLASGRFQISGFMLTFTDARGLFTGEVKYAQADWIEVYQGMRTKAPLTPLRLYGGSLETSRRVPTGADYAGTREYAPGDEYHRIEWKATARLRRLMVKEFHPETQTTLQILIDAGRTMNQPSYVGTKLDEALAVAELLVESATGSGNQVGIWIYDEAEILQTMKPAMVEEQLYALRQLALVFRRQVTREQTAKRTVLPHGPSLRGTTFPVPQVATFVRLLKLRLTSGYRKTGICKTLTEASRMGLDGFFIILTDLQTNNDALLEAVSTLRELGRTIVAQIGGPWRFSDSLEKAYIEYNRNDQEIQRLQNSGMAILDVRPERLIENIAEYWQSMTSFRRTDKAHIRGGKSSLLRTSIPLQERGSRSSSAP